MSQKIDAADVHHHAPIPSLEIGIDYGAEWMKCSRVDDHIQAAKFAYCLCDYAADRIRISDIA